LTWWLFLISSAHGAGPMVAPVPLGTGAAEQAHAGHARRHPAAALNVTDAALAISLHVGAMLAVMAVVALDVYDKLGLTILRKAWLNSDQMSAAAFVIAGAVTLAT
jgi:hypothetical protein